MNLQEIKEAVESATGIEDISVKSRERNNVIARCIYCYLAELNTVYSYQRIGEKINRDHSTVLYSIKSLETHLAYEPEFRDIYRSLKIELSKVRSKDRYKLIELIDQMPAREYKKAIKLLKTI